MFGLCLGIVYRVWFRCCWGVVLFVVFLLVCLCCGVCFVCVVVLSVLVVVGCCWCDLLYRNMKTPQTNDLAVVVCSFVFGVFSCGFVFVFACLFLCCRGVVLFVVCCVVLLA